VRNGPYTAVVYSLLIHGIILLAIVLSESTKKKIPQIVKTPAIKSFLYYDPKVEKNVTDAQQEQPAPEPVVKIDSTQALVNLETENTKPEIDDVVIPVEKAATVSEVVLPEKMDNMQVPAAPKPSPRPIPPPTKLDSFTQLQRLRSKLNRSAIESSDNPYQTYQPPSAFNTSPKTVPHAVPLKDEEKEREKNTKAMGAGIAITKNDDGTCSVTQDMSAYGLSEGSSTQYFNCGESKFDKSFREHMKKIKAKLGK
jgi:hypothetical protein